MHAIESKMVDNYINNVCGLIKNKKVHKDIKEELLSHIEEIIEDSIESGKSEEEAINYALEQMGSYDVVGNSLNKVHKAAPDCILILMTSIFISFGVLTLVTMDNGFGWSVEGLITRIGLYLVIGILGVCVISKLDYRNIKNYSKHIYIGTIILLFVGTFISTSINGAMGFIRIGPVSVNIMSIAPTLLVISLAGIYEKYDWSSFKNVIIGFALGFGPGIFFMSSSNLPSLGIYGVAVVTLMIISCIKLRDIIFALGTIGTAFIIYIISAQYRVERLTSFLKPMDNQYGSGWIYNQTDILRKSAGLFGQGANYSNGMLPEAHTDYILTYIIYTFGWIIGIILIALVLAFIIRIGFIGMNTKDKYGKLIVSGLCALFATQFIFNILMNLNLAPSFSVSLPFVSYGGTALVVNMIAIGIITNVYKWRNTPYITI